MFNTQQFNQYPFNTAIPLVVETFDGQIVYNGYVLHDTEEIHVSKSNHYDGPTVERKKFNIPGRNGVVLTEYNFRERKVIFRGRLVADSSEELEIEMDRMKSLLCQPNQTLQVYISGEPRVGTAHLTNPDSMFPREHYNIDRQIFELIFEVTDPFWRETGTQSVTFEHQTATLNEEIVNLGTAPTDPVVILNFEAAVGITGITFTMGGRTIQINQSISALDIVTIGGTSTKPVTINGDAIDFDGRVPEIAIGNNPYTISITGTSYDVAITTQRQKRFI